MNVLHAGERLDAYRVERVLKQLEGAVVYLASEEETSRAVVITVLEAAADDSLLRTRAERAEQEAGLARTTRAEPIAIARPPDGTAYVVTERLVDLPIITRSPAPLGAFGASHAGDGPMDAGHAMIALTSQRVHRRATGRLSRLGIRALLLAVAIALGLGLTWLIHR